MTFAAFQGAVCALITQVSGLTTLWGWPSHDRPSLPFLSVSLDSLTSFGDWEQIVTDNPTGVAGDPEADPPTVGTELLIKSRKYTQCEYRLIYSASLVTSMHTSVGALTDIIFALARADWAAVGSFVQHSSVQSMPHAIAVGFEGGAFTTFTLSAMVSHERTETYVETVKITPTIDGVEQPPYEVVNG